MTNDDSGKNNLSRRDLLKAGGIALAGLAVGLPSLDAANANERDDDVLDFVDPFIGTGGHGHTYPGASAPFGMVQLSPDSGTNGWDWCSGYNYLDKKIAGFSHTHLSGTGIGDLGDILITPILSDGKIPADLRSDFSHNQERARPGYYSVHLNKYEIKAELSATPRVGLHRYTYQLARVGTHPAIVIDLGTAVNWDNPTDTFIKIENSTNVSGYRRSTGWAKDQHIYFYAHFSQPIKGHTLFQNNLQVANASELQGKRIKAALDFDVIDDPVIEIKVGISAVSIEGAKRNLKTEVGEWYFDYMRHDTQDAWRRELNKVRVVGDETTKKIFYTSLYHSMLAPTLFCDSDRTYLGPDKQIHQTKAFNNYTTLSLWDTFRGEHPLLTILQPNRVDDMVQSMMAFYRENGLLPVWPLVGCETNTMIGYHSVPVIADAYFKGLTKVDPVEALEAMKKSALQDNFGLRFYKTPTPTTVAKLKASGDNQLKLVRPLTSEDLKLFGQPCPGYSKSISGNKIGYHSSYPTVRSALISRTRDDKWLIEWESAPAPKDSNRQTFSFVWLAGLDTQRAARQFDLLINGEKWFSFNEGKTPSENTWQKTAANGATLTFLGSHIDQYNSVFGHMFLTVPPGVLRPDESIRFSVTPETAGTEDWYMTFEHEIKQRVTLQNEYAFVEDNKHQVIRADIENVGLPAEVALSIDGKQTVSVSLGTGTTTEFIVVPAVDKEADLKMGFTIDGKPIETIPFKLRPVRPYNYIPADREIEAVSKTLECAYDDWCIAQMAKAAGRDEDHRLFAERSQFYRNLYDRRVGFMRGKLADGSWRSPFSPKFSEHRQDDFTEGNAWQFTWFAPHDVPGLIELLGGKEAFVAKLDQLFNESSELEGTAASPDISGMIGQYAHGNEPSHHISYLYALAGQPWKTQARVRSITGTLYSDKPDGLCGNEDCGQMSAWYVLSAMGFYPVNPSSGVYVIGTPHFERVVIEIARKTFFTIIANNISDTNIYIQSATLNGNAFDRCYINHKEIIAGGTLIFVMGSKPNMQWGLG